MPWASKYSVKHQTILRDVRPFGQRLADDFSEIWTSTFIFVFAAGALTVEPVTAYGGDILVVAAYFYLRWLKKRKFELPLKLPMNAKYKDPHNPPPGKSEGSGKPEGILFFGNDRKTNEECWLSDSDARTHILFLGTTGSGKTEGLKSIVSNSLCWGSGFVYIDGKADTDLWANLFSLTRRFGRDDDLLVLNYMTGNSDKRAPSNSMNPFSSGSASYLVQMLVSLMPEAGGDNAMWKERAVALISALMPALTWKRDKQNQPLDIGTVRDNIELQQIIKLSRDPNLEDKLIRGLQSYLATLPGYVDAAFDDDGQERPPSPDSPVYDLSTARQQHGYLSMQFTRSLQSLADDYGYIFKEKLADIDIIDVVLNRRILVVLIPALEKSGDEAANLGKIVAACLKGMMGSTLGSGVEGSWQTTVENKVSRAASPYITVFDEVGYYTSQGMAVMAAQARSLGFSLVFASQDIPSMEKRVREEARSITGNCNLKIFGKLEDPTGTKEFFDKTIGGDFVMETNSFQMKQDSLTGGFISQPNASLQTRNRSSYDALKSQTAGQVHLLFAQYLVVAGMYYCVPDKVKALRVQKLLPVPPSTDLTQRREKMVSELAARLQDPKWNAEDAGSNPVAGSEDIKAVASYYSHIMATKKDVAAAGIMSVAAMALRLNGEDIELAALPKAAKPAAAKIAASQGEKIPPVEAAKDAPHADGEDWHPEPPSALAAAIVRKDPSGYGQQPAATQDFAQGDESGFDLIEPSGHEKLGGWGAADAMQKRGAEGDQPLEGQPVAHQAATVAPAEQDPRYIGALVREQDLHLSQSASKQGEAKDDLLHVSPEIAAILSKAARRLSENIFTGSDK